MGDERKALPILNEVTLEKLANSSRTVADMLSRAANSGSMAGPLNALTVFPLIQQRLAEKLRPLADLQQRLVGVSQPTAELLRRLSDGGRRVAEVVQAVQAAARPLIPLFEHLARAERRKRVLQDIGILPHPSTPFELLDEIADPDDGRAKVRAFYEQHWDEICDAIVVRSAAFNIDGDAKTALAEALALHQAGKYRAVCALLLLEIERVARVEIQENGLGTVHVDKVLGELALELYADDTDTPVYYTLSLYERLTEHLYVSVRDEETRHKFEKDPVPNRHAAVHGLIVYKSFWNSLNVIFMADYAFQVVSAIKNAKASAVPS